MNFAPSSSAEHRDLLGESVAGFVRRGTDIARVRKLRDTQPGFDRAVWRQMAELGWLGILVPEGQGGLGLGFGEMAIVLEGLARALVPEPICAAAVLAGGVIRHTGNRDLGPALLAGLVAGELIPALAWQERAGTIDVSDIAAFAAPFEGGFRLNGVKRFVHAVNGADGWVVSARGDDGLVLAWLPAGTAGVSTETMSLADGRNVGTVRLADAVVPREQVLAQGEPARRALERAIDETLVMTGAELLGVMGRALDMSLDYMKTRVQFGKPIGSFQALQHRAVDLYIQRELASAALADATAQFDGNPAGGNDRALMASRVKARCAEAGLRITREAIQIHGAIGFTDEYDVGLYLKRALVLASWLGNTGLHRRRYARLAPAASD